MTEVSCAIKMSRLLLVLHLYYFVPGAILTSLFTSTRLTIAISGLSLLDTSMSLRKLCQSTMASMRKPGPPIRSTNLLDQDCRRLGNVGERLKLLTEEFICFRHHIQTPWSRESCCGVARFSCSWVFLGNSFPREAAIAPSIA
jgi:hypothetical protein